VVRILAVTREMLLLRMMQTDTGTHTSLKPMITGGNVAAA